MMTRLLFLLVLGLAACRTEPAPEPLSPAVKHMLDQALQEERYAEYLYTRILLEHEAPRAFEHAVSKEIGHSTQLVHLYLVRGLDVPPSEWTVTSVPGYPTLQEACRAAVQLEEGNIVRYDVMLDLGADALPADVRDVLTAFRREAEQQHLPTVQSCAEGDPAGAPQAGGEEGGPGAP